jgi:peptide chain release factor 3
MKLKHVRSGKVLTIHSPLIFLAQEREMAEEAFAGDIIGIPSYGGLRIGDALTESEDLTFTGIPSFAPEHMQRARADDPLKAKHLSKALEQLAEEGAARIFKPITDPDWVVGVVGPLQFDILTDRIRTEYNIPVRFEETTLHTARWLKADPVLMKKFVDANQGALAYDHDGDPVFIARNAWHLSDAIDKNPDIQFLSTK